MDPSPMSPRRGDEIELAVRDLAFGGAGIADLDGLVVMVKGGLPGDRVRARVSRKRPNYLEARVTEILEPSPHRRRPPCPHTAVCGGCALMGLDEGRQTDTKGRQAADLMRRIGGFTPETVLPPVPAPRPFWYRNKMEFTFSARPWTESPPDPDDRPRPGPALGLHPPGRFDRVFDVRDCRLQSPLTNRILDVIRREASRRGLVAYDSRGDRGLLRHVIIRTSRSWPDVLLVLVTREWDERLEDLGRVLKRSVPQLSGAVLLINRRRATVARGDEERVLWGRPFLRETVSGWTWRIGASSFFQTSAEAAELLLQKVLDWADPRAHETALDLYSGVGAFTLPLARRMKLVAGIESVEEAVASASEMAARHGLANVRFLSGLVEVLLREDGEGNGSTTLRRLGLEEPPHLLLLDPPRSGLHPKALRGLVALAPGRVLYVSCNPSTQARDAKALVAAGYRPLRFQALDLFPQTPHMETLLLLRRS